MPVFGLGRNKSGLKATPRTLPGDGDSVTVALEELAVRGDWPALRSALAGYSGHDLTCLLHRTAQKPECESFAGSLKSATDDALAMAFLGSYTVSAAWRVRTAKRAQHVSQEQFKIFHEMLREAEQYLYASVEADPKSVAPWHSLMTSGRGLEIGLDGVRRRFDAANERSPGHRGVHSQMLQQLCAKWSGSHEQMHEFALDSMRGPHGDVLGHLVPRAQFEHLGALGKDSKERGFIRSAESRAQLQEAADRTIFRQGYQDPRSPYHDANSFAWAFCAAGMWTQARAAFELTDGVVVVWANFNDPISVYTRQRDLVISKA